MYTPEEWKKKSEAIAAEREKQKKLEAATVAFAQPGQMQAERDFSEQGEESMPIHFVDHYGRRGTKWFSFDLPVDPGHPMAVVITLSNDAHRNGSFDILIDGHKLGTQATRQRSPEQDVRLYDVEYALPAELVTGKQKVTVRFEAATNNDIPGVFGIRTIRTDAPR
jgi:hypothetical protein